MSTKVRAFQDRNEKGKMSLTGDITEIFAFIGKHQGCLGQVISFEHKGSKRANTKVTITSIDPLRVPTVLAQIKQ